MLFHALFCPMVNVRLSCLQAVNPLRQPHTDLTSERLQLLSSLTRPQFLQLTEATRQYGPTVIRRDSLCHEAELLLYLWR